VSWPNAGGGPPGDRPGGHRRAQGDQSKGADALLRELETLSDRLLVVCDEADQLRDKRVLADLYGIDECTLIVIGNREAELFAELDAIAGGHSRFSIRWNESAY